MSTRKSSFGKNFPAVQRRSIMISGEELTRSSFVDQEKRFPLMVEPRIDHINAVDWASANREWIDQRLLEYGVVLFRGFGIDSMEQFHDFARELAPELLDYRERAAPRTEVAHGVYTSTEFPADQYIPLHHEMSYSHNWPTKLFFYCDLPPAEGGRTPVTDDREIIRLIDPKIKEGFMKKKVMYVRNYGEGVDLAWQQAFQTQDKSVVEEYCKKAHMVAEWKDRDRLRTRAVRQAVATHPKTGDTVWFNHAHMFHVSNLEPKVRESLLKEFGEEDLPRNAFYGDGSPIEASILDEIREVYNAAAVRFDWHKSDVMMVDNFLSSHGRQPFSGQRRILVAMADLYENKDLACES